MKFNTNEIYKLLEFKPEEGQIFFTNERMLLFQAQALEQIREELIQTLGGNLAMGVLMRFGYRCGFKDAESITKVFGGEIKWIELGPLMYRFEGFGEVTIQEKLEYNPANNHYLLRGRWKKSTEVTHHLRVWGIAPHPVCWVSTGYASGFASGFTGMEVYCKELTCVGKGDSYCTWEMRSKDSWGDEAREVSKNYSPKFEFKNLEVMLAEQRSIDIHQRLTQLVLEDKGIDVIADTISEIIGSSVAILNKYYKLIATSCNNSTNEITENQNEWKKIVQLQPVLEAWKSIKQKPKVVQVKAEITNNLNIPLLLSPIVAGSKTKGVIIVQEHDNFSKLDIMAITQACTVCGLEILKEEAALEAEIRIKGDYFDELMSITSKNYKEISTKAMRFGYDIEDPHVIMAIEISNWTKSENDISQEIIDLIQIKIQKCAPHSLITLRRNKIIIVLNIKQLSSTDNPEIYVAEKLLQWIKSINTKDFVNIGIGKKCLTYENYKQSYEEAIKCVEIMKGIGRKNSFCTFAELGIYALLWNTSNKDQLLDFAMGYLKQLIDYDEKRNTKLLETLDLYLKNNRNLKKTAEENFIHISSFKYRIKRISELTGLDLSDENVIFNIQTSLRILKTLQISTYENFQDVLKTSKSLEVKKE